MIGLGTWQTFDVELTSETRAPRRQVLERFLAAGGKVIDSDQAPIRVRKVGLERWVYRLSLERPFWYGLLSLALAVAAGWGASAGFRALRRG